MIYKWRSIENFRNKFLMIEYEASEELTSSVTDEYVCRKLSETQR